MHDIKARFEWKHRLHRAAEFEAVFADKKYRPIRLSAFTVYRRDNNCGHPRLGLSVPRRAVKKAVHRNRMKRSIRETFRQQRHTLPDMDFVVTFSGRAGQAPTAEMPVLLQLWREAADRGPRRG